MTKILIDIESVHSFNHKNTTKHSITIGLDNSNSVRSSMSFDTQEDCIRAYHLLTQLRDYYLKEIK